MMQWLTSGEGTETKTDVDDVDSQSHDLFLFANLHSFKFSSNIVSPNGACQHNKPSVPKAHSEIQRFESMYVKKKKKNQPHIVCLILYKYIP